MATNLSVAFRFSLLTTDKCWVPLIHHPAPLVWIWIQSQHFPLNIWVQMLRELITEVSRNWEHPVNSRKIPTESFYYQKAWVFHSWFSSPWHSLWSRRVYIIYQTIPQRIGFAPGNHKGDQRCQFCAEISLNIKELSKMVGPNLQAISFWRLAMNFT